VVLDDLQLPNDNEEVPKYEQRSWRFDSWLWNVLSTWQENQELTHHKADNSPHSAPRESLNIVEPIGSNLRQISHYYCYYVKISSMPIQQMLFKMSWRWPQTIDSLVGQDFFKIYLTHTTAKILLVSWSQQWVWLLATAIGSLIEHNNMDLVFSSCQL